MIPYIGDFAEDATIYHYFNTFDSNDPSASVTATDLADTDLFVYKDGSVTDLVTDGASVVIDFDGRTGAHKVTIDTSAHVDYATGSDYMVLMNGVTVDGGTINAALFTFSIENRTTFPKADYPTNFAAMGIESDGDLTKVNTLDGHTAQTGDSFARIGANGSSLTDLSTAAELAKVPKSDGSASWNATALAAINAEADTALTDYDAPTKAEMDAGLAALNDLSAAQVNAEVDTALADYDPPTKAELDSGLAALNDPTTAEIADAVLDEAYEGTTTFRQYLRLAAAALWGKASGLGTTTATFRNEADDGDRIVATVDADGNRTAVTTTKT